MMEVQRILLFDKIQMYKKQKGQNNYDFCHFYDDFHIIR